MPESLIAGRVLITGATGGLGQAIAGAFAREGAKLVLSGRRVDLLQEQARQLSAEPVVADLSERSAVEGLVHAAGPVDVLIANAALPASGAVLDLTQAQIDTMLEVNLGSQIALARALAPGMVSRGRGHIVFMSSIGGIATSPGAAVYSAAKFGLRGFALALREDLRSTGVGVSVVLPWFISEAGMFAETGASLPLGVGTKSPAQVAGAVLDAVRRNRAEVTVAPWNVLLGARVASVAPALAARFQRIAGGNKVSRQVTAGQLSKRPPR